MSPKLEDITFALKIVCNQIKKRRIDTREEKLPKIDNITFAPKMYSGRLREELKIEKKSIRKIAKIRKYIKNSILAD